MFSRFSLWKTPRGSEQLRDSSLMRLKRPEETYVRTAAELTDLWRGLMGRDGFGRRSLWTIFFYPEGRLSPVVSPIDDVPEEPDDLLVGNLANVVAEVISDLRGTVAFLLSRPGPGYMTDGDRRWARTLRASLARDLSPWPVHLGTRDRIHVFAPDDLIPSTS